MNEDLDDIIQQITLQEEIDEINLEWEAEYGELDE